MNGEQKYRASVKLGDIDDAMYDAHKALQLALRDAPVDVTAGISDVEKNGFNEVQHARITFDVDFSISKFATVAMAASNKDMQQIEREMSRLTTRVETLESHGDDLIAENDELRREIERLRLVEQRLRDFEEAAEVQLAARDADMAEEIEYEPIVHDASNASAATTHGE